MVLVLYGHLVQGMTLFFTITSPVKIPLFFAITGYVFNPANGDTKKFLKKLFIQIIIPWLCLSAIYVFVSGAYKGISYMIQSMRDILIGKSFWYMNCIIVAEIIWFFIRKYGNSVFLVGILSFVCSVAGYLLTANNVLDFFMINRAIHAQFFIFIGFIIKEYEDIIFDKLRNWQIILLGVIYFGLCFLSFFVLFPNRAFDIHKVSYYNIPFCFLVIILGCWFMFSFGKRIENLGRALTFIGQNTLVYYILGGSCTRVVEKAVKVGFSLIHISLNNVYIIAFIDVIIGCALTAVIAIILKRYLPFTIGKKRMVNK